MIPQENSDYSDFSQSLNEYLNKYISQNSENSAPGSLLRTASSSAGNSTQQAIPEILIKRASSITGKDDEDESNRINPPFYRDMDEEAEDEQSPAKNTVIKKKTKTHSRSSTGNSNKGAHSRVPSSTKRNRIIPKVTKSSSHRASTPLFKKESIARPFSKTTTKKPTNHSRASSCRSTRSHSPVSSGSVPVMSKGNTLTSNIPSPIFRQSSRISTRIPLSVTNKIKPRRTSSAVKKPRSRASSVASYMSPTKTSRSRSNSVNKAPLSRTTSVTKKSKFRSRSSSVGSYMGPTKTPRSRSNSIIKPLKKSKTRSRSSSVVSASPKKQSLTLKPPSRSRTSSVGSVRPSIVKKSRSRSASLTGSVVNGSRGSSVNGKASVSGSSRESVVKKRKSTIKKKGNSSESVRNSTDRIKRPHTIKKVPKEQSNDSLLDQLLSNSLANSFSNPSKQPNTKKNQIISKITAPQKTPSSDQVIISNSVLQLLQSQLIEATGLIRKLNTKLTVSEQELSLSTSREIHLQNQVSKLKEKLENLEYNFANEKKKVVADVLENNSGDRKRDKERLRGLEFELYKEKLERGRDVKELKKKIERLNHDAQTKDKKLRVDKERRVLGLIDQVQILDGVSRNKEHFMGLYKLASESIGNTSRQIDELTRKLKVKK